MCFNTLVIFLILIPFSFETEFCMCVPFWQCLEDNSDFNEYGVDIVDIRWSKEQDYTDNNSKCTGHFDVCCPIQCGFKGSVYEEFMDITQPRIVGKNNEARFAEFPWMLGLLYKKNYHCGASLIHPQVALTAAHCVQGKHFMYRVRGGEYNWDNINEPISHQDRFIRKIIIHPFYIHSSLHNDIALLILDVPFRLMDNVGIVCLPPRNVLPRNSTCLAMGWGKNSYKSGIFQSVLKKVDLPIMPRNRCQATLRQARLGNSFYLHYSFLCAGGKSYKDTCKGDGGSPLVCLIEGETERYHQVGIVSWGLTCGVKNTPGVYTNVALFRDWIDRELRYNGFDIDIYKY